MPPLSFPKMIEPVPAIKIIPGRPEKAPSNAIRASLVTIKFFNDEE